MLRHICQVLTKFLHVPRATLENELEADYILHNEFVQIVHCIQSFQALVQTSVPRTETCAQLWTDVKVTDACSVSHISGSCDEVEWNLPLPYCRAACSRLLHTEWVNICLSIQHTQPQGECKALLQSLFNTNSWLERLGTVVGLGCPDLR